jgi:predicted hydrocarbon binding protein
MLKINIIENQLANKIYWEIESDVTKYFGGRRFGKIDNEYIQNIAKKYQASTIMVEYVAERVIAVWNLLLTVRYQRMIKSSLNRQLREIGGFDSYGGSDCFWDNGKCAEWSEYNQAINDPENFIDHQLCSFKAGIFSGTYDQALREINERRQLRHT